MTFVVNPQVVLREADVTEFVLRAPGAGQRRLLLVHGRVQPLQPPLQLLFLLVQGRIAVRERRRGAAAAPRRQARRPATWELEVWERSVGAVGDAQHIKTNLK